MGTVELTSLFLALFYTLGIRPTLKNVSLGFIIIGIPSVTLMVYSIQWVSIITLIALMFLVFYYFSKTFRVFIDIPMIFIGGILSDHLTQFITISFFSIKQLNNTFLHILFFVVIFVIYIYLFKKAIKKVKMNITLPIISQLVITIIVCVTVLVLYLNIFIPSNRNEILLLRMNLAIQLGYFLLIIFLFSILLKSVKKENELKRKALQQEQFSEYMHALEKVNQDMNKFRHDYANILLTMRGYLEEEDIKGLKEYFQLHILKAEEQTLCKNQMFSNLENLKLIELKGLLATKALFANQLNVKINIDIPEPIESIDMDIIDLTRVTGILMDNAIEACQSIQNRQINFAIIKTEHQSILMVIENQTELSSINIKVLYQLTYSTKGNGRGIGLPTVKEIIKKYPNTTMNTHIENNWFIQEIEIQA